ncbi:hypothetical protein [Streptomyces sp. NPDC019539]|uniref:hypothetical protein n=1 Tax=Streptomyces sp. NPDC019539 TaxID=3365063 RepID=UPI0037BDAE8D
MAGLHAEGIAPLAACQTAELLVAIDAARYILTGLATTVADLLYEAIPKIDSTTTRRKVLEWRRAAHSVRPMEVDPDVLTEVRSRLTGADTTALDHWAYHAIALRKLRATLEETSTEAAINEERTLRKLLDQPKMANALAVMSPMFSQRIRQQEGVKSLDRGQRLTAYRYAMRAALKTSPLSSFTEIVSLKASDRAFVRVSLHPLIVRGLLLKAAVHDGIREHLCWRVNSSLRTDEHNTWLIEPQLHVVDGGIGWVHNETIDARQYSALIETLQEPQLMSQLRLSRYLDSGLIEIDDPCLLDDLLDWLTDRLAASPTPSANRAGIHLASVGKNLVSIEKNGAKERTRALAEVGEHLRLALRELGAPDDWPLNVVSPIYEDRAVAVRVPPLSPSQQESLRKFAELACDALELSSAYQAMVGEFVARFGPGGTCSDVFAFSHSLVRTGWPYTARPGHPARPGRSSSQPCVSVLFQCAEASDALEPTLVVNHLMAGTGGLLARFHRLLDVDELADQLRCWLRKLYPAAELVEFMPARVANPLQADSSGVLPALHWPTATRQFGPGLAVDDLNLVHDPHSATLELRKRDGTLVAPVYLGTVPQHLVTGAERVLLTLSNPWVVPAGLADASDHEEALTIYDSTFESRRHRAGVVVSRARWRFNAKSVPQAQNDEPLADFLERVDQWRRAHRLPTEVYARVEPALQGGNERMRKPLWLAFASPTGMEALAHLTAKSEGRRLVFTECLPLRKEAGLAEGRVTEHIAHFARLGAERGGD